MNFPLAPGTWDLGPISIPKYLDYLGGSWNRGTPSHHTCQWYFPWNKPSSWGYPHLWKNPFNCEVNNYPQTSAKVAFLSGKKKRWNSSWRTYCFSAGRAIHKKGLQTHQARPATSSDLRNMIPEKQVVLEVQYQPIWDSRYQPIDPIHPNSLVNWSAINSE